MNTEEQELTKLLDLFDEEVSRRLGRQVKATVDNIGDLLDLVEMKARQDIQNRLIGS